MSLHSDDRELQIYIYDIERLLLNWLKGFLREGYQGRILKEAAKGSSHSTECFIVTETSRKPVGSYIIDMHRFAYSVSQTTSQFVIGDNANLLCEIKYFLLTA